MSNYVSVLTNPFNLNKSKFPGKEKTKSYCIAQYVLYNTLGMVEYPGTFDFPYLNQVRGTHLGEALMPSISGLGTRIFLSRSGARSAAFNYLPGSPEAIAAAVYNQSPGVTRETRIPDAMTDAEIALLLRIDPAAEEDERAPVQEAPI